MRRQNSELPLIALLGPVLILFIESFAFSQSGAGQLNSSAGITQPSAVITSITGQCSEWERYRHGDSTLHQRSPGPGTEIQPGADREWRGRARLSRGAAQATESFIAQHQRLGLPKR